MRILFLGYGCERTRLVDFLEEAGHEIEHKEDPVTTLAGHDMAISFGYRHILTPPILATAKRPPINLHISYLPYNRGSHPLFWAVADGTPIGVTIHEIDEGIDTGPVCYQELVDLPLSMTFREGHASLLTAVENLFEENSQTLMAGVYPRLRQSEHGTSHKKRNIPPVSWSDPMEKWALSRVLLDDA